MPCRHFWVPVAPYTMNTFMRCVRCKGKTALQTLYILYPDGAIPDQLEQIEEETRGAESRARHD